MEDEDIISIDSALPEIQAKLLDISDILQQLPQSLQAKALEDIESLAVNLKGKLVKSEDVDENMFLKNDGHEETEILDLSGRPDSCMNDSASFMEVDEEAIGVDRSSTDLKREDIQEVLPQSDQFKEETQSEPYSNMANQFGTENSPESPMENIPIKLEDDPSMNLTRSVIVQAEEMLATQIKSESKKREKCLVCKKKFIDKSVLREHMRTSHNIKFDLQSSNNSKSVKREKRSAAVVKSGTESADSDRLEAAPTTDLSDEEFGESKKPTAVKTEVGGYKCTICDKVLSREIGLKQHMSRFHRSELSTTCDICNKSYATYKHLLTHQRVVHGSKRFYCDQCAYSTKHSLDLKRHFIRLHRGRQEYPYGCTVCGKRFVTSTTLRKHSEVHDENRPVQCCKHEGCEFTSRSSMSLTLHVRHKHMGLQKRFECEFCGKKLGAKTTYDTHLRRHKGQYIYRCIRCPAAFPCRTQLTAHAKTHGQKTESCPECSKMFNSKAKVARHMLVHSGEKKHACPYCQYRCNLDSNLRKHCMARHNVEHPLKRLPVERLEHLVQENSVDADRIKVAPQVVLGKHQKIELMLPKTDDGSVDTGSIVKFLERQGFYGQQSLQVDVGGQSFIVNCKKKGSGRVKKSSSRSSTAATTPPSILPKLPNVDTAHKITVGSQQNNLITKVTLETNQQPVKSTGTTVSAASPGSQNTTVPHSTIQLSSTNEIEQIDGECVLSEEALRQITMLGDPAGSPVIVIQQEDGTIQVQPRSLASDASTVITSSVLSKSSNLHLDHFELGTGKSGEGIVEGLVGGIEDVVYADIKQPPGGFHINALGSEDAATEEDFTSSAEHTHQMLIV